MHHEHDTAIAALYTLRTLTSDYVAPEDACESWRELWSALEEFEAEMYEHIRLENGILFPRALRT